MLRNYFKIALRTLRRHKGYALINILGLSIGLACVLLIGLYVRQELSYDDFHRHADRIYRVAGDFRIGDRESQVPMTPAPMSAALVRDFPEVQTATRLFAFTGDVLVRHGAQRFTEDRFYYADSTFFQVFSFPLVEGDPEAALDGPNAIVLTESAAEKYFGNANPMGQTLQASGRTWQVRGVARDVPPNSHMQFDFLASMEALDRSDGEMWLSTNYLTYVKITEAANAERFEANLSEWVKGYAAPQLEQFFGATFEEIEAQGGRYRFYLQPLTSIHLHSHLQYELEPNGDIAYIYVFSAIAAFILLLACVNFMNLATARAAERAQEVGMRKALGARRAQLASQFLGEAFLMTVVAFGIGLVLARTALPLFNEIAGKALDITAVLSGSVLLGLVALLVLVGFLAGSYPAFILSGFQPASVLKSTGKHTTGGRDRRLRKGLVVIQFTVTIVLLVGTMVAYNQFEYIQNKNLGYDKDRVVLIKRGAALGAQQAAFKDQVRQRPEVIAAGASDGLFLGDFSNTTFVPGGKPTTAAQNATYTAVDHDFVETMGMTVVAGRDFDPDRATDSTAVLLNERAAQLFGWTDPVGKRLRMPIPNREDVVFDVIGVVEDFHYESLHRQIQPLVLMLERTPQYVYARLQPGTTAQGIEALRSVWQQFAPEEPFNYTFLDQNFAALHQATQRTGRLFGVFTALAVLIACLGLFGLATHAAHRRTKEIGIRKALGASVASIVSLLSNEFLRLVALAFLMAVPLAYFAMQQWLQDFAYRIEVGAGVFLLAGGMALLVALGTVSVQALRAARMDPVKALHAE